MSNQEGRSCNTCIDERDCGADNKYACSSRKYFRWQPKDNVKSCLKCIFHGRGNYDHCSTVGGQACNEFQSKDKISTTCIDCGTVKEAVARERERVRLAIENLYNKKFIRDGQEFSFTAVNKDVLLSAIEEQSDTKEGV